MTAPSPARPSMGRSRKQPRRQATRRIQAHTASAYGYAAVPSAKPNTGRDRKWLSPQEQTGMPVRSTTPCDTTAHTTQRRPGHNLCRGAFRYSAHHSFPDARATLRDTGNQSPRFNGPASLLISMPFSFMQSSVISKALRLYLTAMALRCDLTNSRPVSNSGLQLQYTSIRT